SSFKITFVGTAPFTYTYLPSGGSNITGTTSNNPVTINVSPGTTTTYTLVNISDANCNGGVAGSATVTVNALPTPAIAGNLVFCQGDNTILNAGAGYNAYLWSTGSTAQTINTGAAGNYSVIVTNGNGCTASTSATVIVNALPTPVITGTAVICQGTTSILNGGNYVSYAWSTGASTPTITVGAAGNYTVTVTDANGCVNSSPAFALSINQLPEATISQSSAICIGGSSSFKITFVGTAPFTYTYLPSGGSNITGTTSNNPVTINVSPGATTTYKLVSITDANCSNIASGSITVTVNALPTPAIAGLNVICDGATTVFSVGNYSNYQWSTGANTQSITVGTEGTYTITVTDGNGCINSDSEILTVNETPVVNFTNDTSLTCETPIINFTDASTYPAGSTFAWDFGDGAISSLENPSHIFANPGTYPISLTITSSQGCAGISNQNVDIQFYPLPVAEFKANPTPASVFNSLISLSDLSQNAITWNWDFGDGKQSTQQFPKHYYDDIGEFKIVLTVTSIAGCVSKYEQEVLITPFYIPNAFTPNGDGVNDEFFDIGYPMDVTSYHINIWSRWGQKVYENENHNQTWNGVDSKGKTAPQGTYVYQIKVVTKSSKEYSYEGTVNLIR
ncbi:MAG: PKD domain-containing protein, partial [Bacteroidia bacterium]